jgi:hypothetical protein
MAFGLYESLEEAIEEEGVETMFGQDELEDIVWDHGSYPEEPEDSDSFDRIATAEELSLEGPDIHEGEMRKLMRLMDAAEDILDYRRH